MSELGDLHYPLRITIDRATGIARPWKKRGPKPKPLLERPIKSPLLRPKRTYKKQLKVEVLRFLMFHKIDVPAEVFHNPVRIPRRREGDGPVFNEERRADGTARYWRRPTYEDAGDWFKVPRSTILGWWKKRVKILSGSGIDCARLLEPVAYTLDDVLGPLPLETAGNSSRATPEPATVASTSAPSTAPTEPAAASIMSTAATAPETPAPEKGPVPQTASHPSELNAASTPDSSQAPAQETAMVLEPTLA